MDALAEAFGTAEATAAAGSVCTPDETAPEPIEPAQQACRRQTGQEGVRPLE